MTEDICNVHFAGSYLGHQFIVGRGSAHELRLDTQAPRQAVGHRNLDAGRLTVASGNQQRRNVLGNQPDA